MVTVLPEQVVGRKRSPDQTACWSHPDVRLHHVKKMALCTHLDVKPKENILFTNIFFKHNFLEVAILLSD